MVEQMFLSGLDNVDVTRLDQRLEKCAVVDKKAHIQLLKSPSGQYFTAQLYKGKLKVTDWPNEYFARVHFNQFL